MKIGFFDIEGWEEDVVRKEFPNDDLFFTKEKLHEFDMSKNNDFDAVSVFVSSEVSEKVINRFPSLKFITTRSTGFDHVDLNVCKEKKSLLDLFLDMEIIRSRSLLSDSF